MKALAKWITENGSEGRKALFLKIKEKFPRFTQTSLSHYINKKRIPERIMAEIIAEFIGVPLEEIPYRYVYRPKVQEEATKKIAL